MPDAKGLIKTLSCIPLAAYAGAQLVEHADGAGRALGAAAAGIPALAEKIGEIESGLVDLVRSRGESHRLTYGPPDAGSPDI
jgi:hypothetical protein